MYSLGTSSPAQFVSSTLPFQQLIPSGATSTLIIFRDIVSLLLTFLYFIVDLFAVSVHVNGLTILVFDTPAVSVRFPLDLAVEGLLSRLLWLVSPGAMRNLRMQTPVIFPPISPDSISTSLSLSLPQHSPPKREVPKSLLKSRLKAWQSQGGIIKLWEEIQGLPAHSATSSAPSLSTTRALHWARLGQLSNAIKAISSSGVADPEDSSVQAEILKRHPEGPVLLDTDLPDLSPAITVTEHLVLKALKAFPKGSSPGGFQLRAQHLLDAVSGFTAPVSQDCLHQLLA